MPSALILVPSSKPEIMDKIEAIRKKYDKHTFPAHITLCYIHDSYDIIAVEKTLEKLKKFKIYLSSVITTKKNDLVYFDIKEEDKKTLHNIVKKLDKLDAVIEVSKTGYHLTLGYEGKKEKVIIPREEYRKIKTPIQLKIGKIWQMKKKEDTKEWYRAKTFYLKD